jgi:hypothetical protein
MTRRYASAGQANLFAQRYAAIGFLSIDREHILIRGADCHAGVLE